METKELVKNICEILDSKQAYEINIINVDDVSSITSYFITCSAKSSVQVKAIAEEVEFKMEKLNERALRKEWTVQPQWIVLDYADVIVHIFHEETRGVYQLDKLWSNGGNIISYTGVNTEF